MGHFCIEFFEERFFCRRDKAADDRATGLYGKAGLLFEVGNLLWGVFAMDYNWKEKGCFEKVKIADGLPSVEEWERRVGNGLWCEVVVVFVGHPPTLGIPCGVVNATRVGGTIKGDKEVVVGFP